MQCPRPSKNFEQRGLSAWKNRMELGFGIGKLGEIFGRGDRYLSRMVFTSLKWTPFQPRSQSEPSGPIPGNLHQLLLAPDYRVHAWH